MKKTVLITGVSSGIGFDAARLLLEKGHTVLGSVRRTTDGEQLQKQLGERFTPLLFDVTDETAVYHAAEQVKAILNGAPLHGLVNNAGIAVSGPVAHVPLAEFRRQFEVNLFGAIGVTQAFLPLLAKPDGRIVNISSVSGKIAYPFFGPYAASKHALEAISDALRRELAIHGMHVAIIEPGSVQTPIWQKAEEENMATNYQQTPYRAPLEALAETVRKTAEIAMPVELVSQAIFHALTADRPKIRYALPNNWLGGWLAPRFLPQRWIDRIITKQLKLTPS